MSKYYNIRSDDGWWTGSCWGDYVCEGQLYTEREHKNYLLPHGSNVHWCEVEFNQKVVNELLEYMKA